MIARIWHGRVPAEKADAYREYLLRTGVSDYQATQGNLGVYVMCRVEDETAHFEILTFWESVDSIKAFAGEDYEVARYYEQDDEYLLEREANVRHLDVVYHSVPRPGY